MAAVELPPLPEAQKTYAGIPEAVFLVIIPGIAVSDPVT